MHGARANSSPPMQLRVALVGGLKTADFSSLLAQPLYTQLRRHVVIAVIIEHSVLRGKATCTLRILSHTTCVGKRGARNGYLKSF